MKRVVAREQVIYGHFKDYLSVWQEIDAYSKSQGWVDWTLYSPVSGIQNEVVAYADFASLADFEREMKTIQSDATFMEMFRRQAAHVVQGSSVSEILETLEDIA